MLWRRSPEPLRISLTPDRIVADGYDSAVLEIQGSSATAPRISGAAVEEITWSEGKWQARIRGGVTPGTVHLHVEIAGYTPATATLTAVLDPRDTAQDGTPDFLRLDDSHDRQQFRRWFTYLAESQYFQEPVNRPAEINDCAALIRYAYREALRAHDTIWAGGANLPVLPAFDSVARYRYPNTPLGPALFRVREGPFRAQDLADGAFLQFADARTLWRYNTHFAGRDLARALPGDLLFFRQENTYHSMIYLGESQLSPDGKRYIVYHTGPEGSSPGEMRRLTVEELARFPQPEWRPVAGNPSFLGAARWNILRKDRADVRQD
jgi:hypothetical protein